MNQSKNNPWNGDITKPYRKIKAQHRISVPDVLLVDNITLTNPKQNTCQLYVCKWVGEQCRITLYYGYVTISRMCHY